MAVIFIVLLNKFLNINISFVKKCFNAFLLSCHVVLFDVIIYLQYSYGGNVIGSICVRNEVACLKKVLLHRPGNELLNLTPTNLDKLLFDDIPFLELAQREHDEFANVLRSNGVDVVYLEDLMVDVLELSSDIKKEFLIQFIKEANILSDEYFYFIFKYLDSFTNMRELILKTMEGIKLSDIGCLPNNDIDFFVDPMPNLYFTRDHFVSVGDGIILNNMYSDTRSRETIYAEYIFKYHPEYRMIDKFYDRYMPYHIEGGDVLILNSHVLIVGVSQRTELTAVKKLAKNMFQSTSCDIDTILVFCIPNSRAFMHLDTVFTQVDVDKFVVYSGILDNLQIFEITKENDNSFNFFESMDSLDNVLEKYLGKKVTLIFCAGGESIYSEREQWNDAANTLCIAPGVVIVYNRNTITNRILREHGIKVIEIGSSELSRGRGGPRCMSMPLIRDVL